MGVQRAKPSGGFLGTFCPNKKCSAQRANPGCFAIYKRKCVDGNIKALEGDVQLHVLWKVKRRSSHAVHGGILSATASRSVSGKYHLPLCCRREEDWPKLPATGAIIGLDFSSRVGHTRSNALPEDRTVFQTVAFLLRNTTFIDYLVYTEKEI